MNDTTIDPQKDAQATEEMLAMLDALEQEATTETDKGDTESGIDVSDEAWATEATSPDADTLDTAEQAVFEETDVDTEAALTEAQDNLNMDESEDTVLAEENEAESSEDVGVETEGVSETIESTLVSPPVESASTKWDTADLSENDALDTLVPDAEGTETAPEVTETAAEAENVPAENDEAPAPTTGMNAEELPQQALTTLETAAELKTEAEELAAEVHELEQETATTALSATESLQDETEHAQSSIERTLSAAEQAFNLLRERGVMPSATALDGMGMDPETLMQKLAELEARNQKLRERNEAIKARLAALK
jgi:cell division protein FtsB